MRSMKRSGWFWEYFWKANADRPAPRMLSATPTTI